MLEMGIQPAVASASAAAMILFTSAAASICFVVFGLLHVGYGVVFFLLGFVATVAGQYGIGKLLERHNRQSPIVLSIGLVICLSSLFVGATRVPPQRRTSGGRVGLRTGSAFFRTVPHLAEPSRTRAKSGHTLPMSPLSLFDVGQSRSTKPHRART